MALRGKNVAKIVSTLRVHTILHTRRALLCTGASSVLTSSAPMGCKLSHPDRGSCRRCRPRPARARQPPAPPARAWASGRGSAARWPRIPQGRKGAEDRASSRLKETFALSSSECLAGQQNLLGLRFVLKSGRRIQRPRFQQQFGPQPRQPPGNPSVLWCGCCTRGRSRRVRGAG